MTGVDLPRITVVLASTSQLEDDHVMVAIRSVEDQDYPDELTDFNLVVAHPEDLAATVDELTEFGVRKATTDWVAIIKGTEEWVPYTLDELGRGVARLPCVSTYLGGTGVMLYRKDYWLRANE